jgi:CRP-like cAMP-binding protein
MIYRGHRAGRYCTIRACSIHEQIGALTGITRVTATRAINRLKQRGILRSDNGYFRLCQRSDSH